MSTRKSIKETEQSMAKCLRTGNRDDFKTLYDHYAPLLLGIISRVTESHKEAEDLLLKTFLQIWENRESYNSEKERPFMWMIRFVRKMSGLNRPAEKITTENENWGTGNSVYTILEKNTGHPELDYNQQAMLDLVYFKGHSLAEAATKLNITESMLTANLRNAIKKLKAIPA